MWELRVRIVVIVVASCVCVAVAASVFCMMLCRIKKMKLHGLSCSKSMDLEFQQLSLSVRTASEKKVSFESASQMESLDDHILPTTPKKLAAVMMESYTMEELRIATMEFSSSNLIEGSVYHGRLKGKSVAIKRTEPQTISKIKFELFHSVTHSHPNIIRLLGVCTGTRDAYLVLEYAENGSLKDWIHGGLAMKSQFISSCSCFLTWKQRLKICLDVATALQYMHQILHPSYVHRNIKSRNIFLDEEFNAKICNFGMEQCITDDCYPDEESSGYLYSSYPTTWDKGYVLPEHLSSGSINPSTDIYAYGVVLLEILSGKPPIRGGKSENKDCGTWLSHEIKLILKSGNAMDKLREWMDTALGENYSADVAVALANLARACVDDDPLLRPNAREVVQKLSEMVARGQEQEQMIFDESSCKPLVVQPFAIEM